jgi:hypothetical protein
MSRVEQSIRDLENDSEECIIGRDPIRGRDMRDPLLAKDDLMGYCIIYSYFLNISEYSDLIQISNFEDQISSQDFSMPVLETSRDVSFLTYFLQVFGLQPLR